jgi:hypothetical protein
MPLSGKRGARWTRRAALLGVLALSLSHAAAAGEFRLILEGEAGVRNDGNYGRLGREVDPEAVDRDDSVGRAGLDLRLSYALQRLNLALGYAPSYERSLEDADISGTTHRLDFGLVGDLTRRLQLNVRERLLSTPNLDLYAPAAGPQTTTVTRRGDQLSHALDVTLNHNFSRRSSLTLGVNHSLRKYEDENLFDSEALGASIGAGFDLERGHRIEVAAGVGQFDYQDRGDADVRTVGVAWAYDLTPANHLRLEGGAYSVDSTERLLRVLPDPEDPGAPGVTETVLSREEEQGWRGGLQFAQERQLIRWALGLSHDISPGAGLGRAVEADNAFLGLSVPVGRRLELGLDGNASRQNALSSRDELQTDRQDELTEFAAGTARAAWTFAPAFRLEGGYSRVWQRSRVESFGDLNYARYFLSLAVRIYNSGETPKTPESLGRPTDEEPDDQ